MDPILDTTELAAIRELGVSMMTTPIIIKRSRAVTVDDPVYDVYYDYGDDEYADPEIVEQVDESEVVYGWFVTTLQSQMDADIDISTQSLHVVRLPVGTDVRPKDTLVAQSNPDLEYNVIDANEDDTWPEWLKVNVRRSE